MHLFNYTSEEGVEARNGRLSTGDGDSGRIRSNKQVLRGAMTLSTSGTGRERERGREKQMER